MRRGEEGKHAAMKCALKQRPAGVDNCLIQVGAHARAQHVQRVWVPVTIDTKAYETLKRRIHPSAGETGYPGNQPYASGCRNPYINTRDDIGTMNTARRRWSGATSLPIPEMPPAARCPPYSPCRHRHVSPEQPSCMHSFDTVKRAFCGWRCLVKGSYAYGFHSQVFGLVNVSRSHNATPHHQLRRFSWDSNAVGLAAFRPPLNAKCRPAIDGPYH